ncbi:MAG: hypothetical protein LH650_16605, partial [Chloroflexi bacterium]|nr:hypothetical protein [Chloroflexota bacterium]
MTVLAVLTALIMGTSAAPAQAADGALDTTFDTDGKVTTAIGSADDYANSIAIQADGKIVAGGHSGAPTTAKDFAVARYNADGSLDTTFDTDGKVTTPIGSGSVDDIANSVAIHADGKIVLGGYRYLSFNEDFALARYNANGSLDTTFDTDGKVTTAIGAANDRAYSIAIQPDGKVVAGGFSDSGSTANNDFALVRYNTDGSLDDTFDADGIVTTGIGSSADVATSVVIQPDGKIVAGGYSYNGSNYDFALARYNPNGSLATTFGSSGTATTPIGTGADLANSVALQTDGKIVIGGYGEINVSNDQVFGLARFNPNGSLDSTFDNDGVTTTVIGISDVASSVAVQSSGKIVAGGYSYNGSNSNYDLALVRYNPDGSLDTTFDSDGKVTTAIGSGDEFAMSVAIQSDSRIVAGGAALIGAAYDFALARYDSEAPSHMLSVTKGGTGSGTVTSAPAGIDCGATCTASFTAGVPVTLSATPASGSAFVGWSGACAGVTAAQCTLVMDGAKSAGATFSSSSSTTPITTTSTPSTPSHVLSATKGGTGSGTVTSAPAGIA